MNDATIEQLRSSSLHSRYGAVMALRRVGPSVVEAVLPLIPSSREKDLTRLAALEAVRPFYRCIDGDDLLSLSRALPKIHSPALKIEIIKLLMLCRFVRALPHIRKCLDDHSIDERIQIWFEEDGQEHRVSTHAHAAIQLLEPSA